MQQNSTDNNQVEIDEINLLDYANIVFNHRRMIVRNFLVVVILVGLISMILPSKYTAVSTLMPPQEQDQFSMASLLSDVSLPGFSLPTDASPSEILVEILRSRSVSERVLNKSFTFNKNHLPLYEILKYDSLELALLYTKDFVKFDANQQGIISVTVELKDRKLAADVTNTFVKVLDQIKQEKSVSRAKNSRIYIESQLQETEQKLEIAAIKLAEFQKENKAISIEVQLETSFKQAGELKGQIIAKEVQLGILLQTMKPKNPIVIQIQKEIYELNNLYRDFQYGSTNPSKKDEDFYLPFADMPDVGLQLAKLTREVKVQETVWTLLNQQFYQAKIEEARDTPTVQVLDKAVPPVRRSSPKRKLLVIGFGLTAFLFSIIWAFGKEYFEKLNSNPQDKQRLDSITKGIRQDIKIIKSKFQKK